MPRTRAIDNLSLRDLQRLMDTQQGEIKRLERRRADLQRELDQLDRRMTALGGTGKRRGRPSGRAQNSVSLPQAIAQVLSASAQPMDIGSIMKRVLASGYRTNSNNFRTMVTIALSKDKRFQNVSRGVYQARGAAGAKGDGAPSAKARRGRGPAKV
jgi:hypothetical protein